ncbi:MAG: Translation initiation factor IF-2 [Chlamydiae bacterium]|nr:Translation initiation factor IF-2 [Chlamydiota bacterium]
MEKKELKLNIKNTQIAKAIKLDSLKQKLAEKNSDAKKKKKKQAEKKVTTKAKKIEEESLPIEEEVVPRRKARSKSVFAEAKEEPSKEIEEEETSIEEKKTEKVEKVEPIEVEPATADITEEVPEKAPQPQEIETLGPTGRHIKDLLPPKPAKKKEEKSGKLLPGPEKEKEKEKAKKGKPKEKTFEKEKPFAKSGPKSPRFREYRDIKPSSPHRQQTSRFDARDRQGLRDTEGEQRWRKRRSTKQGRTQLQEDLTIRPSSLAVRVPISIKDLAAQMKVKASELISKLFLQGIVVMINDILEDETTIQLLGTEFDCEIMIDTSEEERIRITGKTIKEEIQETDPANLTMRAPVVTFMGHVDHGKTSLIDYIRKANTVQGEAGSITQHIGAFLCNTAVGDISILDTPGHEAFSAMRARGADATDIVVLVIAGDEGMKAQTEEAIDHAKAAGVTIIVAVNKSDKANFDPENVYRQLADHELLPEAWGGQTITVNCSAVTGDGVKELLEMLALQAEVLELRANPQTRARGTVLESELHKGLGAVATILVQNGTLKQGDPLVFGEHWGRVKTMRDEFNNALTEAPPSTPIEITGLSGLPEAGQEFIVVSSEKEAREIAEVRMIDKRELSLLKRKKAPVESLFQEAADKTTKILNIILRADVQGSLEALKTALQKTASEKAEVNIISSGIGEISESDVLLAAASKAIIIGFHTSIEAHADALVKQHNVHVSLHDIIYHAIDDVKGLMTGLLDKISQETDKGKAEVRATFKASQLGVIAGCLVTEGTIHRNHYMRVVREGEVIWKGGIASLKRVKEDVREVQKGVECGILLSNFNDVEEGDILEAYEVTYISQKL